MDVNKEVRYSEAYCFKQEVKFSMYIWYNIISVGYPFCKCYPVIINKNEFNFLKFILNTTNGILWRNEKHLGLGVLHVNVMLIFNYCC